MIHLLALAAIAQQSFAPLNHKTLPPSTQDFFFVALGDNRPAGTGLPPTRSFREILKEIGIIGPSFVLSGGDLFFGNDESLDAYKQEIAWTKPLLEDLPCPFFNAPGNHEINNRQDFLNTYKDEVGPLYGSFAFGNFRFVAVCTELPGPNPAVAGDELDWLKGLLADPKPTVVFHHHPIFARESNADKADTTAANSDQLHQLYLKGGVKLVLEAHDHVYNHQEHDGLSYTIAGGAGAPLDADTTDGGYFHYLLVHVQGDQIVSQTPLPLGALEVTQNEPGVAIVADYANVDLPLTNLEITSDNEPKGATASSTNKGKTKVVTASLVSVTKNPNGGYVARVAVQAVKHRTTIVKLSY